MKRTIAFGTLSLAFIGAASMAHAAGDSDSGWYGNVNVGRADTHASGGGVAQALSNQGVAGTTTIDNHSTGYSVNGGYKFNKNWGVEGGYVNLGNQNYQSDAGVTGRSKTQGVTVAGVGSLPLANGITAYGKAGLITARTDLSASSGTLPVSDARSTVTRPFAGVGASYDLGNNLSANVEVDHYHHLGNSDTTGRANTNLYTVGLGYKFN